MKIQGWIVERFGALRNYEVRELAGGLTVFCGPNGSGKSTLFAFLKQMLFGGAPAAAGGRGPVFDQGGWAGRLYCAGPGGTYTIARKGDASSEILVTRPDGTHGDQSDIDRIFGGTGGRSAGSLLAFDINDLQALPPLSGPVRERLFPAGAGRELRGIQRALDDIHTRKSALAAAASRDLQRLPAPIELQSRIERSTRAASKLSQLLQSQAQARHALDLRTRAIADLVAEHARYEALVDLSPVWQELAEARRDLESTDPIDEFPVDSEQRLQTALTARQAAQRTVAQLVDHPRPGRRDTAVALEDAPAGTPGAFDSAFGAVVRQKVQLPGLAAAASASDDLAAWQRRLKDAVEAARESERQLEATERAVRDLELTRNEISTTLARPEPPGVAVLDEEARLVQHVRTTLAALATDQTATKRWQDQIAERSSGVRNLETQIVSIPSSAWSYLAWCAAVLAVAAAGWRYTLRDDLGVMLLLGCSLASLAAAAIQRRRRVRALEEDADRRNQLAVLRTELERACQSLLHHQERAARRRFDISVDSVRLGLPPMPSDLQLKEREAELEAQRRHRTEWDKAQETLSTTLAALARNEDVRRQQAQAVLAAQTHERQTIQQWQQWKIHAGLAESGAGARGAAAENPRSEAELVETCRRLRIQIAEWEQNATDWNSRARAALASTPEPEDMAGGGGGGARVAVADSEVEHSPAVQAARRRLRICEDAVGQLFAQAGVSDEIAFRARLATYRKRLALTQTIRACETRYHERLRREPSADAILRELADGHVDDWRRRAAQAAAERTRVEADRDEALRQLRQIEAEIASASAESSDLPVLEAERSGLMAEAAASIRAARILAVAGSLLEDARRHVERESQPPAFRRGSEALSAITFSRYERLGASEDQRDLVVFDARDGWKPASELSRGMAEQLYFSLRIGLADDYAQSGAPLPIVVDDVLDHFDPKRSQAMARQLIDLSRRHQILVFTRRPETCDLLRNLDPAAHVVNMQEL